METFITIPPDDHLGPEILRRPRQGEKAAWEAIVLPAGTPLDKCECYVNLFRGASRAVTGVVEVADGTKSVKIPFRFPESSGNRGADAETRPKPYWEKIELSVFSSRN